MCYENYLNELIKYLFILKSQLLFISIFLVYKNEQWSLNHFHLSIRFRCLVPDVLFIIWYMNIYMHMDLWFYELYLL